jgi:triosephosphate isomerase
MYFGYTQTVAWCETVREVVLSHPAIVNGSVELFVIPAYPVLARAKAIFAGTRVELGAQNLHWEDSGPFTGEVSGSMLAELGCRYVEVGHAERRQIFGESDDVVAAKTRAALRNGLIPIICVGEFTRRSSDESIQSCHQQIESALSGSDAASAGPVIIAYEPIWAIGASEAAPTDHIEAVCKGIKAALRLQPAFSATVIYGGAAGPGLLSRLRGSIDGLFLGRSAHEPSGLVDVLGEALSAGQTTKAP